ncbi:hypothetical protein C1646_766883 [Rhizophagus diaphanus]|nr:hypothetical protein C1646_766883 [Rhizophagus diaphanus] [Rhizophagus sp. MUCL 43196]
MNLWKVNIAHYDEDKLRGVTTKDNIEKMLGGKILIPTRFVKDFFSDQPLVDENIHGIVQVSAAEPNFNDPDSIYKWMQQHFALRRDRNRLVTSFGKDFEFYGRDDAIDILWNGDKELEQNGILERFKHPSGPGTGKSRFLDEIGELLRCNATVCDNKNIQNVIWSSSTPLMEMNALEERCLAYEAFFSSPFWLEKDFGGTYRFWVHKTLPSIIPSQYGSRNEIGKGMKLFENEYVKFLHPYFRVSIGDIGGHVRTLEYFYEYFQHKMETIDPDNKDHYKVEIKCIIQRVESKLSYEQDLDTYSQWITKVWQKSY